MKTETFEGSVSSAYGEKLPKPIKFNGSFEAFETYEELLKANAVPSNEDVVDFVNTRRKNNERQRVMTLELEKNGHTKPDPNDAIVVAKNMIKNVEAMENMKPDMKAMMVAALQQQIKDEETKRASAKSAEPTTVQ